MRILHLSAGSFYSGASKGAYFLHKSLCENGINSIFITNSKENIDDKSVLTLGTKSKWKFDLLKSEILRIFFNFPKLLYFFRLKRIFNSGFSGFDITKLPEYQQADIIHLHWICGFISINTINKIKKPIIWTLRDMWPFTGGCHYSMNCERYKIGCGKCPQLNSKKIKDYSRLILNYKKNKFPKNLNIVGISKWISHEASKSLVFKNQSIQTIPNCIDTEKFKPLNKKFCRESLNLSKNKKIILLGALSVKNFYKGFDLFLKSLNFLDTKNIEIVIFGEKIQLNGIKKEIKVTNLGYLSGINSIQLAYSSADVFVSPSRQEAFGKTIVEAQSCGIPVVCFNNTGSKDIIKHKVTGYLAKSFDEIDLAKGIEWVLNLNDEKYNVVRQDSQSRAKIFFDSKVIAMKYENLYKSLIIK